MAREEAVERFRTAFAEELHCRKMTELEEHVEREYEKIQAGIVESLRRLFAKIGSEGKEPGYITVSLLRTSLKFGEGRCLLSAYGDNLYLDNSPIEEYYDAGWLLSFLNEYGDALDAEIKKYVGKITRQDTEKIKWGKLCSYKSLLVLMFRKAIEQAIRLEEYAHIKISSLLDIRVGEYHGLSESIWVEEKMRMPEGDIKALLEKKYEQECMYRHYKDIDISCGEYAGVNFTYSRFERVNLSGSAINGCILSGTRFDACDMERANLQGSTIWLGDFSRSSMKEANLSCVNDGSELDVEKMDRKIFTRTSFRDVDLRGADLSGGDFTGCDFRGAELAGCNTEGAKLYKALIEGKYADDGGLALTEEQRGEISWTE